MKFIAGVIFGIVISTVGLSGIARLADNSIVQIQAVARESVK